MNIRPALSAATSLGVLAIAFAAISAPNRPQANAAKLSPALMVQYKALYSEKCSACHDLPDPVAQPQSPKGWQRTVDKMLTVHHASDSISPTEATEIVSYLSTFAPPARERTGRMQDPWATDATDVWTDAPSQSRVFNFIAPSALSEFSILSGGASGPSPVWQRVKVSNLPDGSAAQVRLPKPSPNRFGLLMDKTDVAQNVDVQVRFHILQGKVSPAVGIVFGFNSSKDYSVLTYNQATNDLSLIQIAEPQHTTLQKNPINLPAGGATTAAQTTSPAPSNGWHTLRLLVRDGQVRGWLDHTKRIGFADPAYHGGKIGLWSQGDTVAAFQDWTVDLYNETGTPVNPNA